MCQSLTSSGASKSNILDYSAMFFLALVAELLVGQDSRVELSVGTSLVAVVLVDFSVSVTSLVDNTSKE